MALNLADSGEIMAAYDAVLNNELNWFLLHYSNHTSDELSLYAFGAEGLEELKTKIDPGEDEQILVGFLRVDVDDLPMQKHQPLSPATSTGEEEDEGRDRLGSEEEDGDARYLLVSYVARGVLGVRRARAQVHTRRLGMIFKVSELYLTSFESPLCCFNSFTSSHLFFRSLTAPGTRHIVDHQLALP
ncbi:hypothetical protein D9756_002564 [Leucocoprinus leucothites]|uniref:Uncharacterized protein n=1 Tax=Leucocoprinus leucothites TaxID=201217 RepID=A0A8H5GC23_9AGAR|nr:hypothetical protein D9756_002564 [Leucoagaricus leucothites]